MPRKAAKVQIGHEGDSFWLFVHDNTDSATIFFLSITPDGLFWKKSTDSGATYTTIRQLP